MSQSENQHRKPTKGLVFLRISFYLFIIFFIWSALSLLMDVVQPGYVADQLEMETSGNVKMSVTQPEISSATNSKASEYQSETFKNLNTPDSPTATTADIPSEPVLDAESAAYNAPKGNNVDISDGDEIFVATSIGEDNLFARNETAENELREGMHQVLHISGKGSESKCSTKKRIILNVNKCGLGNRMVSLVSTIMLALLMDRVIELDWVKNLYCGASYSDLFHSKSQADLAYKYRPFVYDKAMEVPNSFKKAETVCQLYFDQTLNYTHLTFLTESALYARLNEECKVIRIEANIYYAKLLFRDDIGGRLHKTFHHASPFHQVSQIVFRPAEAMRKDVMIFIEQKFQGKPWLSIHARGYYDDGSYSDKSLACAKKLLETGVISYVFFASEATRLIDKAKSLIDEKYLVTIPHSKGLLSEEKNGGDSFEIRRSMNMTLLEWLLIGEGTYCTATSIRTSTFSKTSIVHGPCKFIYAGGSDCK